MSISLFDVHGLELRPLIADLHWDFRAARVLHVANRLDLFTSLDGRAATLEEIVTDRGTDPNHTERLLIALCAMGLLEKVAGRYRNTTLADTYLVRGRPLYQGDIIAQSTEGWNFWTHLEGAIRTGRRDAGPEAVPPPAEGERHRHFIRGMHNLAVTGSAQMIATAVDLSSARRLLDVGGGPGTHAIVCCQKYPHLQAVVFDLPQTLTHTAEIVTEYGLSDRIHLQPGDWNEDEFGADFDAVLLSMAMHGAGSQAAMKLGKAFRALNPGGWLLVQEFLLNAEKTGPLLPALFNLMVGAYSLPELLAEIEAAGFVGAGLRAVGDRGNSLVVARKPKC
jgi:predicted O-methyltransferase YrrM